ncbi:GumC family protein [Agarivorans sp. MS3-6]|uniref:GumC family protein n=1 Tax=Agarivorans sp. TSD2052 TaxID=2937286 RepID=UPI00200C157E|nr:polysaccharide biosynthesis tyrosine autokinase [Agarivorans sp. TSD2052]UPW19125.1 polysaccharide biosynthesis tyrosine autokinase [Agarivorans sp. TSD2052]
MEEQKSSQARESKEVDLRQLFITLWQARLKIILVVMVTLLFSMLYVKALPSLFQASSKLMIGYSQAKMVAVEDVYSLDTQAEAYFNTEIEILRSERIALAVIQKLDLQHHPEFLRNPISPWRYWWQVVTLGYSSQFSPSPSLSEAKLLKVFKTRLSVTPLPKSRLIEISFRSWDRLLAQQVSNAISAAYIEYHRSSSEAATDHTIGWLLQELNRLKSALQNSEVELQLYREQENLVDQEGILGLIGKELQQLTSQQLEAQRQKSEASSLWFLVKKAAKGDLDKLTSLGEIQRDPMVQSIKRRRIELELELADLAKRYGPKHPKRVSLAGEISRVELELRSQTNFIISGIEKNYQAAVAREAALADSLRLAKIEYQDLSRKTTRFNQLTREIESNARLYNTFLEKFKEAEAAEGFNRGYAQMVDSARLPEAPIKPKKAIIVILAGMLASILSVVFVLIRQAMSRTFATVDELETALNVEVIAEVPKVKVRSNKWLRQGVHPWLGEPLRSLRARLQMRPNRGQVVLFTSALEGEGKTSLTIQTAAACSDVEKVLLIDADLRRASVSTYLNYPLSQPGLTHLLSRTHTVSQCIHRDNQLGFDVLTAGLIDRHSTSLLASKKFKMLLKGLRQYYDRIVIETGPLMQVSDAVMVAPSVDATLLVVQAERTDGKSIENALNKLSRMDIEIAGVVFNKVARNRRAYDYDLPSVHLVERGATVVPLHDDVIRRHG